MIADTTKYVLLAAKNSLQSVLYVDMRIFLKLCFKNGIPITFHSHGEHGEKGDGGVHSSFLRRLQV